MTREEILQVLPQREPMLMVDDILELVPGQLAVGYKKIGNDEVWMQGHFPGEPVLPGVLLIEHMAQVSLFLAWDPQRPRKEKPYLAQVDTVKFLQPVLPGTELYTEVKPLTAGAGFVKTEAVIYIDKERTRAAARGKLTCYLGMDVM
ncbi:MAG TPA: beta-hydroxyacyl-ACP dehydratase [Candidatus Blautia gallistercoris]|uniref:Beta-hydroxyacyl-ACP dehydratase n=1 Tax=Candidatus Blautia gallistercoris TaxID=2838490 RepID=A0A9D1WHJ3_9FIRM|nr:beta-hydroxyacyl-ACP dehydratase [Candidatus Blautia gallistercoris]